MDEIFLFRFVCIALFLAIMGGSWDIWWHASMVRDTFFEPPHLLLYTGVLAAIGAGMYGWYRFGEKIWRNLAVMLLLIPASGPFDELWHRMFGVEDLTSPLIVWSPPHLALVLALMGSFLVLLTIAKRERDPIATRFFGALIFGALLLLAIFLTIPLQPVGAYAVLGFFGSIGGAFALSIVLLSAQRWLVGIGKATLVVAFFLLLQTIQFEGKVNPDVIIAPHDHPPSWLFVFSFIIPAGIVDICSRLPVWMKGILIGFLWAGIFYGFSWMFFDPEFQYSLNDAARAIISGSTGGLLGGFAAKLFFRKLPNQQFISRNFLI